MSSPPCPVIITVSARMASELMDGISEVPCLGHRQFDEWAACQQVYSHFVVTRHTPAFLGLASCQW